LWSENLKIRDHLEDISVNEGDNIRTDLREIGWEVVE
jgi:hypothetical protein